MTTRSQPRFGAATVVAALALSSCAPARTSPAPGAAPPASARGAPRVGPLSGSVLVVGGGAQGPEIYAKFIAAAGGPDALIINVPTAGGDTVYPPTRGGGLRAAGARNVVNLHTKSRAVANADSFVAPILKAGGV